ncbi:HxlR family transcriptional regulator [Panacagrimonas perspica]|uniref:HxlR family transcriptional regulator n=1 Tax=Panacagrimonas perspica TaxID=381431 RepID=A0A4R7P642_9GAMM|nr:helix-turn-helix domain-containing protein [Panacagrimonas perspica]TDU28909.1 HxlR family transcriptional regulator [Panacagrimonas perspica]THD02266.1 transcriptional regulator [Panacagrimonas perspica]
MSWSDVADTSCAIARALAVVGDRWTGLILRELFLGNVRFEAIQLQTGASSHLLSTRLKRLEKDGIVVRHPCEDHATRYEYRLTPSGSDLLPFLLSLKAWGEKWGGFRSGVEPAQEIVHRRCGHSPGTGAICEHCGERYGAADIAVRLGKRFKAERRTRIRDA